MMNSTKPLRVLSIHGVGEHHSNLNWTTAWRDALAQGIRRWDPEMAVEYNFLCYDDVFAMKDQSEACLMSWLWMILGADCFRWLGRPRCRSKPTRTLRDEIRWTAGMVVQWMSDVELRRRTRERVASRVESFEPDVICAHSLGSLIAYDAIASGPTRLSRELTLVTFGSQIGNRCVQQRFPDGLVTRLPVRHWYHLYNRHDDIFTARIRLTADNFSEINAHFNLAGPGDHAAAGYLAHAAMSEHVWRRLLEPGRIARIKRVFCSSDSESTSPTIDTSDLIS